MSKNYPKEVYSVIYQTKRKHFSEFKCLLRLRRLSLPPNPCCNRDKEVVQSLGARFSKCFAKCFAKAAIVIVKWGLEGGGER